MARKSIDRCEKTLRRIEEGLTLLETDAQVFDAFRFLNHAMWLQRTRSLFSEGVRRGRDIDYNDVDIPANRSWYPFQLAFILLNLPSIARLDHPDRSETPKPWPTCSGSQRAAERRKPTWASPPSPWRSAACKGSWKGVPERTAWRC